MAFDKSGEDLLLNNIKRKDNFQEVLFIVLLQRLRYYCKRKIALG